MKIAFDIDDCITQTAQTFCRYYTSIYGKNLSVNELTSRSGKFEDTGLISKNQVKKIKESYHKDRVFRNIKPYSGSVVILKNLSKEKIYFITTRNDYFQTDLEADTRYWFQKYDIYNYDLVFTQDKSKVLEDLGIELFVEDNLNQIDQIRNTSNDITIIVPTRPWNTKELNLRDDLISMKNWEEFNYKLTVL